MYIPRISAWTLEVLLVLMCTREFHVHALIPLWTLEVMFVLMRTLESHVHTLNIFLGPGSFACINVYWGVSCT